MISTMSPDGDLGGTIRVEPTFVRDANGLISHYVLKDAPVAGNSFTSRSECSHAPCLRLRSVPSVGYLDVLFR
jgi:hypothetical protein